MLNVSDYDEAAINMLLLLMRKSVMHVPGLRLTVYNRDAGYKLSSEMKNVLSEKIHVKIFTPAISGAVKVMTEEIRRQHLILTANNMMMYAARAVEIKTVILPDAEMPHSGRTDTGRDSLQYTTLTSSDKGHVFFRRLQIEIINALEEAVHASI